VSVFKTSRFFSESVDAVFQAFASPERLARWWGPDGFTNTFDVFEFKNGGSWRFTMHGPDGQHYPNVVVFENIEINRLLVLSHVTQPAFKLTIQFEPNKESPSLGTTVTWQQAFESADLAASIQHIVEPANEQNLSRWQKELAQEAS